MGRVNKNIRLKNIQRKPTMWVKHTYVGDGIDKTPPNLCVPAIKCIAANSEYLSSPSASYLPSNSDDIDIEFNYTNLSGNGNLVHFGENIGGANKFFINVFVDSNFISVGWVVSGVEYSIVVGAQIPSLGSIKVKGGLGVVNLLINDNIVGSVNGGFDSSLITGDLVFNGIDLYINMTLNYIKINNHEWTFPEGTGSTTTNSQGVVTTLHSDLQGAVEAVKCIAANSEYLISPAPTLITEINEDAYIKISFQADANHTVENIDFLAANTGQFAGAKTRKYTVKYGINSEQLVVLLDGVDIENTTPFTPNIQALSVSIPLITGDVFSLYWYPYDAEQNIDIAYTGFWIGNQNVNATPNSSVNIYNASQNLLKWLVHPSTVDDFEMGTDVSNSNYSLGSNLSFQSYGNNGVTYNNIPVSYYDYLYLPASSDDLDIEVDYFNYDEVGSFDFDAIFSQGYLFGGGNINVILYFKPSLNQLIFNYFDGGSNHEIIYTFPSNIETSGNIKVLGSTGNINLLFNNIIVGSLVETYTISGINTQPLLFSAISQDGVTTVSVIPSIEIEYIKINDHEWTSPNWTAPTTTNSQGVITTLHSDIQEVTGVKCVAVNDEYMSSPIGDYVPSNINNIDLEVDFTDFTDSASTTTSLITQGDYETEYYVFGIGGGVISFQVKGVGYLSYDTGIVGAISGNIKVKGDGLNVSLLWNDVVVDSAAMSNDMTVINTYQLYFNNFLIFGTLYTTSPQNVNYNYIKINDHEWTSENWEAPTTTNSQGVITTLHSDVDTNAMIQFGEDTTAMIQFGEDTEDMWTEVCPPE